jgi:3-hydroxyacyl-[acyl-carrier-protein] dehydratase
MTIAEQARQCTLSADQIRTALPHRHPFVMLDRVTQVEPGEHAVGIKNISVTEPCFAGHFPDRYVFPGVLLLEALAQLAGVVYGTCRAGDASTTPHMGYLASVRSFKFVRPVTPGDQVVLEARAGTAVGALRDFVVSATVEGELVATGRLAIAGVAGGGEG